ncbi:hypothetical protein [Paenibacillus sp. UMB4589-SE434]|uniref:hypothetical protein n=1 Tax=Paenibacillus sp. UMB4589-SE434 TaxID=3046314 RepID=UPI00254F6BDA|nr:hypothetical protein [Paenibacillus sp. UMB4589-SE434]MDK8182327.1 hypothetical protein [Paenibacillus sp. UMB4589-SE434]
MTVKRVALILIVLIPIFSSGCTSAPSNEKALRDPALSEGLTASGWIMFEGKKYSLSEIYKAGTYDEKDFESTNTVTGSDDKAHQGLTIFINKKTGSLFIKAKVGDLNWMEYKVAENK